MGAPVGEELGQYYLKGALDNGDGDGSIMIVVATDAPLGRTALQALARAGSVGQAKRIAPVHTPFDGDITFAVSTARGAGPSTAAVRVA